MLRRFPFVLLLALSVGCGGSTPVVANSSPAGESADVESPPSLRWHHETPFGVRALEVLPGGDLLFFAAGQEPAPPRVVRSLDGLETSAFPVAVAPEAHIASGDDKVLIVRGQDLDVFDVSGTRLFHVELPPESGTIAAFTGGYAQSAFVITSQGALHIATPSGLRPIETSAPLTGASVMQRVGGQLMVARGESLWSVTLSSAEVAEWATGMGTIRDFVRDDEGRFIVVNDQRAVFRVDPDGVSSELVSLRADHIAYDPDSFTLTLIDAQRSRLEAHDYLALLSREAPPAERAGPFTIHGAGLSGAEYWPFVGDAPPDYPSDILWGFYPEAGVMFDGEVMSASANPSAIACMERSHAALRTFVQRHASRLEEAARVAPATSARFYLWVDDYSRANDPFPEEMRPAKMWYWQRDPGVEGRIPGYWKWETVLRQNGDCDIPDAEAAAAAIEERIREGQAGE